MKSHPKSSAILAAIMAPVLVATWLLGGFNTSVEGGPDKIKAGSKVELGPIDITVHSATFTNKSEGAIDFKGHPNYLIIRTTITVKADKPLGSLDLRNALSVPALKAPEERKNTDSGELLIKMAEGDDIPVLTDERANWVYLGDEQKSLSNLNPGLTAVVIFAWDIEPKVKPLTKVELQVKDYEFSPLTTLKNEDRWLPASPVGAMDLPVKVSILPEDDEL